MQNPFYGYGQWAAGGPPGVSAYPPAYTAQPPQVGYPSMPPPVHPPMPPAVAPAPFKPKKSAEKGPFTLNPAISIKNQLQEYAQHIGIAFPFYQTSHGPDGEKSGWISKVTFNGIEYCENVAVVNKKLAECRAAEECLRALGLISSPRPVASNQGQQNTADVKPKVKSTGKADLHHYVTLRKLPPAVYTTKEAEGVQGYVSTVRAAGSEWTSTEVMSNKKAAENHVAEIAVEGLKQMMEQEAKTPHIPADLVVTMNVSEQKFKTSLNEYCSRRKLSPPIYSCEVIFGPGTTQIQGYKATCQVLDQEFLSEEGKMYATKKIAEQAAASAAWDTLKDEVAAQDAAERVLQSVPYKIILQEHLGRRDLEQPEFTAEKVEGKGFICECKFEGKSFKSTTPYFNKKTAEFEAAKVALEGLGLVNLNRVVERRILKAKRLAGTGFNWHDALMKFYEAKGKKMPEIILEPKNKRFFASILVEGGRKFSCETPGFQEENSAIQSAARNACVALSIPLHVPLPETKPPVPGEDPQKPCVDVIMDDATGQDLHIPNQSLKRRLEEWIGNRSKGDPKFKRPRTEDCWAVPQHLLKSVVVVEVWPDKKNVVVVGNEHFSCPMLCLHSETSCAIEVGGKSVDLNPGMLLHDLEAVFKFVHSCGGITLLATQCSKVTEATSAVAPVITAAGVVLLTREDEQVKVLLKRYKTSTAFIPASQELSFALRRAGTIWNEEGKGRPKYRRRHNENETREYMKQPVDKDKVVDKIHLWTDEEVDAVRKMSLESMKPLFAVTKWKWMDRWDAVLQRKTRTELKAMVNQKREERMAAIADEKKKREAERAAKKAAAAAAGTEPPAAAAAEETPVKEEEDQEMKEEDAAEKIMEEQQQQNGVKATNGAAAAADVKEEQDEEEEAEDNVPLIEKYGLDEIAACAEAELKRRLAMKGAALDDLTLRPWGFPKGGFRHQSLTTGIYLESAAECARRELKEECGIAIKLPEIESAEKVVVLRTDVDNMNPHEGDASMYFFHEVDLEVSKTAGKPIQELMDISARFPVPNPRGKPQPHHKGRMPPPIFRPQFLLRQKEVHEEFSWFGLEEAAALTPVFNYILTTDDFRKFAKLPPPASPVRATAAAAASTASPMRAGRRGRC